MSLKYINCPCKNCVPPKRNSTCHANCEEYKEYQSKLNTENKKIQKEKDITHFIKQMGCKAATNDRLSRPKSLKHGRGKKQWI